MSIKRESTLSFNIELTSKEHVKRVSMPDGAGDRLMIEGSLGKLTKLELIDGLLLEINGVNGTFRIEISREELENVLA
jgi:hypothetical protein